MNQQQIYKIAPNRNKRHSVRISFPGSENEAQNEHPDASSTQNPTRDSSPDPFTREKDFQRQLSGAARFDRVRRKHLESRTRIQNASQRARKTHERVLRSTAVAEACLVETVPMASRLYVLVKAAKFRRSLSIALVDLLGERKWRRERRRRRKE